VTRAKAGNTTTQTTRRRSKRTGKPRNSAAVAKPRDTARISRSADPRRCFRTAQLLPNYASPTPAPHPRPREWDGKPPSNRLRSRLLHGSPYLTYIRDRSETCRGSDQKGYGMDDPTRSTKSLRARSRREVLRFGGAYLASLATIGCPRSGNQNPGVGPGPVTSMFLGNSRRPIQHSRSACPR